MMGDSRVTRWLSTICKVEDNNEQTWHHLIEFLERDLKAQQQKLLIQNKSETKDRNKGVLKDITAISLVTQVWNQGIVFVKRLRRILRQMDQKGTKIMQYFACQKFVEMAPKDRFQELKNKGYCFQRLFPGTSQDKGKHHDEMF